MIKLKFSPQRISWIILLLICVGYVITLVINNIGLGSKLFAMAFVMACICIFWSIISSQYNSLNDPFWVGLFIVLFASINVFLGSDGNRTLDYFAKVLRFDATVMLIYFCAKYKAGKSVIHYFEFINQILALILIYQGIVVKDTYYIYTTLTLGFPNPNHGGMWSALCICGMIWNFSFLKSKVIKLFYCTEIGLLIYLLIHTGCRSAFLSVCGLIAATVAVLVNIKVKKRGIRGVNKKFYRFLIIMICTFPLIFSALYLVLFYTSVKIGKIGGQNFYSGRELLWYRALQDLKSHCIIGAYNEVSSGTGQSQLHNIYIDILCSYGVIVFVLFFLYVLWIVLKTFRKLRTIQQYIVFWAFLMMFFIGGTFEAAYVSGDIGVNYWTCLFLLFANADVG